MQTIKIRKTNNGIEATTDRDQPISLPNVTGTASAEKLVHIGNGVYESVYFAFKTDDGFLVCVKQRIDGGVKYVLLRYDQQRHPLGDAYEIKDDPEFGTEQGLHGAKCLHDHYQGLFRA